MSLREEQCNKVCRILDDVLANRPTERDSLIVAVRKAFDAMQTAEPKIIRCNECKWNITENRKETKQWLPCRAIVTPDDFSCIYAEGKANG